MREWNGAVVLLLLAGCANFGGKQSIPNAAARKCLDDGYRLVAVKKDGVPRWHLCIDSKSGKKCEVWAYFRGECRL